jgi:hypothetical protein
MIELQAPFYVLKKALLRSTLSDEAIKNFHLKFLKDKEDAKPEA